MRRADQHSRRDYPKGFSSRRRIARACATGFGVEAFCKLGSRFGRCIKRYRSAVSSKLRGDNISYKTVHSNRTFRVIADTNYLYSILRNLISNALKFTNPDGSVVMELYELRKRLIISVKDNGRGINPSHIETILSAQDSVSNLGTAGKKGTGMGFSLASQL